MIVKSCSYSDRNHRTILPFNISNVRKLWVRRTKWGIRKGQRGGRIRMFYRPQNRQEWAGESLKKKAVLVSRVMPTQQHKAGYKYFILNPSLLRRLKRLTKDPRKPFNAFNEHLQILQNSSTDLTPCGFLPAFLRWQRWMNIEVISDRFWLVHSTLMIWQILVKRQMELISSLTKTAAGSFFLPPPQSLRFRPRVTRKQNRTKIWLHLYMIVFHNLLSLIEYFVSILALKSPSDIP